MFRAGENGIASHESVLPLPGEDIIPKNFPNSFKETRLEALIRTKQITDLVLCGMMTHICVDTTTRRASDLYLNLTLAHDAAPREIWSFLEKK